MVIGLIDVRYEVIPEYTAVKDEPETEEDDDENDMQDDEEENI